MSYRITREGAIFSSYPVCGASNSGSSVVYPTKKGSKMIWATWRDVHAMNFTFHAPEEIAEIAQKLRKEAGMPDEPTGEPANP